MKNTRRSFLRMVGAAVTLTAPAAALASGNGTDETFALYRAGTATVVKDAADATVYVKAGSTEWCEGSAARIGAIITAVRACGEDGVSEIRLPAAEGRV